MTARWLVEIEALLIDLDGVVHRGDAPLPGARDVVPVLTDLGIRFAFVTNNATLSPEEYAAKLASIGIVVDARTIVTSAEATATYLREVAEPDATVYVVGEDGLHTALARAGFRVNEVDPTYVVAALDRRLTYLRLATACLAIQRGAQFIATNADHAYPVEEGLWPGAGAIVAAISTATGVAPLVIGKPQPTLLQVALGRLGAKPGRAAIIGDQIATDIRAGRAAGLATILLEADLAQPSGDVNPDLRVQSLAELLSILEAARR
ncbi:MAG: HAD-IIA family hydrolase [Chloroflexi bacterium]|nr:HAD-IIA family hydrolase [Chloroflexota bacterium]